MGRHRFRFFVAGTHAAGARVALEPTDIAHVRVLRLTAGAELEVVDAAGTCFDAQLAGDGEQVALVAVRSDGAGAESGAGAVRQIELVAGALTGGRFDELVDGAVQAGASRIVPLALRRADAERLGQRRERLQRIATAAAKQAKRTIVPEVTAPIGVEELLAGPVGIVVDAGAPSLLNDALADARGGADTTVRLLVGPAEGLDAELLQRLAERGWHAGRLGPSILRAELAAPVAVAIAALHS